MGSQPSAAPIWWSPWVKKAFICIQMWTAPQKTAVSQPGKSTPWTTTARRRYLHRALAVRLLEGASLKDAALFANCASSIVVTRKGAQSSIPTREEVEEIF